MKKLLFVAMLILLGSVHAMAQNTTVTKGEMAKTGIDKKLGSLDYTKLFLKKMVIADNQHAQVNNIFYAFLQSKRSIYAQTRKDPAAYQVKQNALFAKLKTDLAAVLTPEQMNAFLASKPAPDNKDDYLTVVFY